MIKNNLFKLIVLCASSALGFTGTLQAEQEPERVPTIEVMPTITPEEEARLESEKAVPEDPIAVQEQMMTIKTELHDYSPIFQQMVSITENLVELKNGTLWEVNPNDAFALKKWQAGDQSDRIILTQKSHGILYRLFFFWRNDPYKYKLVNFDTGDSVEVILKLPPFVDRVCQIQDIKEEAKLIYLTDGTVWSITSWDNYIYSDLVRGDLTQRRWLKGDCIIVGANEETGFFGFFNRPFILMNVNVKKFARAQLVK